MLVESGYSSFEEFLLCMEAKTLASNSISVVNVDREVEVLPKIHERGILGTNEYTIIQGSEYVSLNDIDTFFNGKEVQDEVEEEEKEEEIYTGDEIYTNDGGAEIFDDTGIEQEENGEIEDEELYGEPDSIDLEDEEFFNGELEDDELVCYSDSEPDEESIGFEEDVKFDEGMDFEENEDGYGGETWLEDDEDSIEFEDEDEMEDYTEEDTLEIEEPSEEEFDDYAGVDVDKFLSDLDKDLTSEEVYEKEQLEKKIQSTNENKLSGMKKSVHFDEDGKVSVKSVSSNIPSTFTEYVKMHPYCKLHELYQLYDRKEIDKAVKLGKLFRLGDRVYM